MLGPGLSSPGAGQADALRALAGQEQSSRAKERAGVNKRNLLEPAGPVFYPPQLILTHLLPGSDLREDPHVAKTGCV